jgi:hypothetical protein
MNYSQALEQQAEMYRFVMSGGGLAGMTLSGATNTGVSEAEAKQTLYGASIYTLKSGNPFYWDATTCELVTATALQMPPMTLRPEDLIVPFGFCWFARPLPLAVPDGFPRSLPLVGYAWGEVPGRGVMLMPFSPSPKRHSGAPTQLTMWEYGHSFEQLAESVTNLARKDAHLKDREIQAVRRVEQMRYIAACTVFMQQRILTQHTERADRSTRRRLDRAGWTHDPEIKVIRLRRASSSPSSESGHEPVEWTCQWVVSGHWRQQFYPSTNEHRPVFVLPYIKGPEGLPLKAPAERVFAVVR